MALLNRKTGLVIGAVVGVFLAAWLAWPLVDIELRLWRNGKIAQTLAKSLKARFPGDSFEGAASYKDERVSIIVSHADQVDRNEVEKWLRKEKSERKIAPQIRLRFANDDLGKEVMID